MPLLARMVPVCMAADQEGGGNMGKMSREKGKVGEREVANILKDHGWKAERTAQHMGKNGGEADVKGLDYIHIEVKRTERLNLYDALNQAIRDSGGKKLPVVFHRRNNEKWVAIMRMEDWMELYAEYYNSKRIDELSEPEEMPS